MDDIWRRRGQGTMTVNLRIDGRGVDGGWARKNVFFSEDDISSAALREAALLSLFFASLHRIMYLPPLLP